MKTNEKALNHVKTLIEDLNNDISSAVKVDDINYVSSHYAYTAKVSIDDKKHNIEFERSIIDDLEVALEKYAGTKYFNTLESNVKFNMYMALGKEGLLKGFDVSHKLINDKRDWVKDYRVNTKFSPEMAKTLYDGLEKLYIFFDAQIKKHKRLEIAYSEIEENQKWAQSLAAYYKENDHLDSLGVGTKNLQFFKAAAIMQIIHLEKIKKSETMPTTLKELDNKIYAIVTELRKDPLLEIEPPDFIHDIEESDE